MVVYDGVSVGQCWVDVVTTSHVHWALLFRHRFIRVRPLGKALFADFALTHTDKDAIFLLFQVQDTVDTFYTCAMQLQV